MLVQAIFLALIQISHGNIGTKCVTKEPFKQSPKEWNCLCQCIGTENSCADTNNAFHKLFTTGACKASDAEFVCDQRCDKMPACCGHLFATILRRPSIEETTQATPRIVFNHTKDTIELVEKIWVRLNFSCELSDYDPMELLHKNNLSGVELAALMDRIIKGIDDRGCDREGPTEKSILREPSWIVILVLLCAILIAGLIGNISSILFFMKAENRKRISIFIVSLSCADIVMLLICVPLRIIEIPGTWTLDSTSLCALVYFGRYASYTCSVFTLVVATIYWCMIISHPEFCRRICSRNFMRKITLAVWLIGVLAALPIPVYMRVETIADTHYCFFSPPSSLIRKVVYMYFSIMLFILPLIIMVFCYIQMACKICRKPRALKPKSPEASVSDEVGLVDGGGIDLNATIKYSAGCAITMSDLYSEDERLKASKNVRTNRHFGKQIVINERLRRRFVKAFFLCFLIFFFCWGPYIIFEILFRLDAEVIRESDRYTKGYTRLGLMIGTYFNCVLKPLCYLYLFGNYRQCVINFCCCFCRGRSDRDSQKTTNDNEKLLTVSHKTP